ncbi:MAG: hypothetical protein AMJ88_04945 [Anaerolineae bacterium SM23_ 63]|nr:MAG: hypothetical protein AMJ88_04945 [Anaerolineae bacterium SM23_ 63]
MDGEDERGILYPVGIVHLPIIWSAQALLAPLRQAQDKQDIAEAELLDSKLMLPRSLTLAGSFLDQADLSMNRGF